MQPSKRIRKELQAMKRFPIEGIAIRKTSSPFKFKAVVDGPRDSPYEGGKFEIKIKLPDGYPFKPPKCVFKTKIFHPNVWEDGSICLDILKDRWCAALNLEKVLLSIVSLMSEPNPDHVIRGNQVQREYLQRISIMCKRAPRKFKKTAREWTEKYAMKSITMIKK